MGSEKGGTPWAGYFGQLEIVYRGIFQKTLAKNITRAIVLAAHEEGKPGISFGRYGDSPERNGIPAKAFAIVATDNLTLEEGMAKYEPKEVDITIAVDDTLCKGVESWAWYGLQPINRLLKPDSALIVTSREEPETLIAMCHRKEYPYKLAIVEGDPGVFRACGSTRMTTPMLAFWAPSPSSCRNYSAFSPCKKSS